MANINELTDFLLTTMKETKTFVVEQAPDVAKEMLTYGALKHEIWLVADLIMFIAAAVLIYFGVRLVKKANDYDIGHIPFFIFGGFLKILASMSSMDDILALEQIRTAPKIYIIKELSGGCNSCKR